VEQDMTFVGPEIYKVTIAVAVAEDGRRGEVCALGTNASLPETLPASSAFQAALRAVSSPARRHRVRVLDDGNRGACELGG